MTLYNRAIPADVQFQCVGELTESHFSLGSKSGRLKIVTTEEDLSKASQIAMLHEFARLVYLKQHTILAITEETQGTTADSFNKKLRLGSVNDPIIPKLQANRLESLVRMCGRQLQQILRKLSFSSPKYGNLIMPTQVLATKLL